MSSVLVTYHPSCVYLDCRRTVAICFGDASRTYDVFLLITGEPLPLGNPLPTLRPIGGNASADPIPLSSADLPIGGNASADPILQSSADWPVGGDDSRSPVPYQEEPHYPFKVSILILTVSKISRREMTASVQGNIPFI